MTWYHRLTNAFRQDRLSGDIAKEMAFHVNELVDELVAGGMAEADARLEAKRRFGNPGSLRERVRDVDLARWLDSVLADIRYAFRALRSRPGFTAVAVLSLGLGIGANTAIFSLVNAVMLRSLPVRDPGQLVRIITDADGNDSFTNPLWEQIRDRNPGLDGTLAVSSQMFTLSDGGVVRRAAGAMVSGGYFNVLGVTAASGRLLTTSDDLRGCTGAAVLSNEFAQSEYGSAAAAVGKDISVNGHALPIVGVTSAGFAGVEVGRKSGIFVPLCALPALTGVPDWLDRRSMWFLDVMGRLPQGTPIEAAQARLALAARSVFEATIPQNWSANEQLEYAKGRLTAAPAPAGLSSLREQYRGALVALLAVVGVVLLIACANVAQLLLARATSRRHEVAVRMALGSGRARLIRQLLTESLMLALAGAAAGMIFASWASSLIVGMITQSGRPVTLDLSLDLRVLGFTVAVATITGILFGLAPAWQATRVAPLAAIRGAGRGLVGRNRHRFAHGLVAGQVALSLALVAAAGLLVGSFRRLSTIDPGFERKGVLLVAADWSRMGLPAERRQAFIAELVQRTRAIPGVRKASASLITPIGRTMWNDEIVADGFPRKEGRERLAWFNAVSEDYMPTLGTRLIAGRDIAPQDQPGAPDAVLVNATFARQFFGDAPPIGRIIRNVVHDSLGAPKTVVGVVEDTKYQRLNETNLPIVFSALAQSEPFGNQINLLIRTDGPPAALAPSMVAAMKEVSPLLSLEMTTLEDQVATSLSMPRLLATLSGFFGALALILAVVGLYGTMSYSVATRRNEIGVRIALGAARVGILGMIAREAGLVVLVGVVAGVALTLFATRVVAGFLYGVTATDPVTLAVSAITLIVVAMLASIGPAWKAARVDPVEALRD